MNVLVYLMVRNGLLLWQGSGRGWTWTEVIEVLDVLGPGEYEILPRADAQAAGREPLRVVVR